MLRRSLEYVTEVWIQRHQSETEGRRRRVREAETLVGGGGASEATGRGGFGT